MTRLFTALIVSLTINSTAIADSAKVFTKSEMAKLIHAIDCTNKNWATKHKVEDTDREHYKPLHVISAHIKTNKSLSDGYQKGSRQSYLIAVETYATKEQAKVRADEYRSEAWRKRLAVNGKFDFDFLSKESVRCYAVAQRKKVYLLTTHSSYASSVSKNVISKIKTHLGISQK
jgi:hypothetical protein